MVFHHRHKQRLLTTFITLIVLVLCMDLYILIIGALTLEMSLLFAFALGIFMLTAYHFYNYEHCHEHLTLINNLTQIYFGVVLLVSIIIMLLLRAFFNIEIMNSYIIFSLIVIVLMFLTLGPYDRFLEDHMGRRFPMGAPAPRKKKFRHKVPAPPKAHRKKPARRKRK